MSPAVLEWKTPTFGRGKRNFKEDTAGLVAQAVWVALSGNAAMARWIPVKSVTTATPSKPTAAVTIVA